MIQEGKVPDTKSEDLCVQGGKRAPVPTGYLLDSTCVSRNAFLMLAHAHAHTHTKDK